MAEIEVPPSVVVTSVLPRGVRAALIGGGIALVLAIALCVVLIFALRDVAQRNCQFITARAKTVQVERRVMGDFESQGRLQQRRGEIPEAQRKYAERGLANLHELVARLAVAERLDKQIRDRPSTLPFRIVDCDTPKDENV